jgi:hypothetical protein
VNRLHLLILVSCCLLGSDCVNTSKPVSVQKCSVAGNCSDDVKADAAVMDSAAAAVPDARSMGSPDLMVSSPPDGPGPEQATSAEEVGADSAAIELAGEVGPEASAVGAPEPQAGREVAPETAAEANPEAGAESSPEAGPESGPEIGLETGPETGPEAGPEAVPEPSPEPGPELPPDGGVIGPCPPGGICDDFEDGNYTSNPAWTAPGGFSVTTDGSKVLAYTGTASPAVALLGTRATALTIKARVKATVFGGNSNSYRVGLFARADSQGTPSVWYSLAIAGDGSFRLQSTDSTPAGCNAIAGAAVANTWYVLTLTVGGTVAATTLQGTLSDDTGGNVKTIGPCAVAAGLASGWEGVGIRGGGTHGEFDDVQVTGITP